MFFDRKDAARLAIEPERRLRPFYALHHMGSKIKDGIPVLIVPCGR